MHRTATTPFRDVEHFMFIYRTRQLGAGASTIQAEASPPSMRIARPGERPPSARPPGMNDVVIDRFDMYAKQLRRTG